MRRLALYLALTAVPLSAYCADNREDITGDHLSYEPNGDEVLTGNAQIVDATSLLTADEIRLNQKANTASARGHVVLTRVGDRLLADQLTLDRKDHTFTAVHLRVGRFPYYIEGETAEGVQGSAGEVVVHNATVSYEEPGKWQPTIHARALTYSPGHYLRLTGANVGIGGYRPLPVSRAGQNLGKASSAYNVTLDGGYRHQLGAYADIATNIPVFDGVTIGPDLGIYTFRGIMLGPIANYNLTSGDDTAVGYFKSGYIHDFGTREDDILGNLTPPDRGYAEWHHNQQVTPDLTFDADVNWTTDSEVIREFHSKEFVPVQEPDNFLEAVYTQSDLMASVFSRFQPDSFYPVQERLPELRFDLLPTAIGGGIYVRFDAGLVHLEEHPPLGGTDLASDRFDTFLGLTRPFTYKGIFDFAPVLGGRFTEYWDTVGAAEPGGTGRALGELGFDADLKANAVWDYDNPLWHIDGLRHLLTPTFSYRYIPDGDKAAEYIPPIDRNSFTSYLPIMELGDMRAIDQLAAENVLRFGLHNVLETRDTQYGYGSRNLVAFDVDEDFRFQRAPGQTDFSDIHGDLTMTPARWLEFRLEDTVSTSRFAQRAIDSDVTVREGDVWLARFGIGYLSDNYGSYYVPGLGYNPIVGVDTYHFELRARINEVYEAFTRGDYDARDHIFVDQYYGMVQRIANTWLLEYAIVISNGPNNGDGHFGVEVSLNIVRF
jgi:LPS-assembly protein